jgi:hypothetical protein
MDSTLSILFSLYGLDSGGSAIWSEIQNVDVISGLFHVSLGAVSPISESDFAAADRWIGITVGSDSEMVPRVRVGAVPYALQSGNDGAFSTTASVSSNAPGDYEIDDFVFGSPQLDYDGHFHHNSRFFFDKSKSASRVGWAQDAYWDTDSLGLYSFATGFNTVAAGDYSTAFGQFSRTTENALGAFAAGYRNDVAASWSAAFGYETATNAVSSVAMGQRSQTFGNSSTATGYHATAYSRNEFCLGSYNTEYTPVDSWGWNASDRLFVVGNGTDNWTRSNALTILKNGNVGIGTDVPDQLLHLAGTAGVDGVKFPDNTVQTTAFNGIGGAFSTTGMTTSNAPGSFEDDDFVFGSPQLDNDGDYNHYNRLFFNKSRGAFRAGSVIDAHWDTDSLGTNSFATGNNTVASGIYSAAFGQYSRSPGISSLATGTSTSAEGYQSAAFGYTTRASGNQSIAMGYESHAIGEVSSALGRSTTAKSKSEFCVGSYNTDYSATSTWQWNFTDRLFVVGNGTGVDSRSDAMVILKSGKTGIGTSTPEDLLHVQSADTVTSVKVLSPGGNKSSLRLYESGNYGFELQYDGAEDRLHLWSRQFQGNEAIRMTWHKYGNVGIGATSPAYTLEVNGSAGKPGGGSWTAASDRRLKQNIKPFTDGLDKVLEINPVSYNYNELSGHDTKPEYVGVIAQELQQISPKMVGSFKKDGTQYLDVDNSAMVYMLINAVQEQQQEIKKLKAELENIKASHN